MIENRECARKAEEVALREMEAEQKRKEQEQEMEKKKDLIRQIRSLEKVPVDRTKPFDASEPPNMGFMEEMSLAELRERLLICQARKEAELEAKRERQLEKKNEKQLELAEKVENLAKVREMSKNDAIERQKRAQEKKQGQERLRDQCILEASERIAQEKKQEQKER